VGPPAPAAGGPASSHTSRRERDLFRTVGAASAAYLSHVPFAELGLPEVGNESRAHYGEKVHGVVYKGMVVPTIVYAGLAFLMRRRFKVHEDEAAHHNREDQL
jgi:hypothetical protein